jgi:hypothetical protein
MNDVRSLNWLSIDRRLSEALSQARNMLHGAGLDEQVEEIQVRIDVGEYGIALERLCSHLDEINKPFPYQIYARINDAGTRMGMDSGTWEHLGRLTNRDNQSDMEASHDA